MSYGKTADPLAEKYVVKAIELNPDEAILIPFATHEELKTFRHKMYVALNIIKQRTIIASAIRLEERVESDAIYLVVKRLKTPPIEAIIVKADGTTETFRTDTEQRLRQIKLMIAEGHSVNDIAKSLGALTPAEVEILNTIK